MTNETLEQLSDAELAEVVGGADVYKLLGMCNCGGSH